MRSRLPVQRRNVSTYRPEKGGLEGGKQGREGKGEGAGVRVKGRREGEGGLTCW